ncbi:butyrophilin-like protein 8 [Pristis pectinata]|uniref:butyrophilin-like protein 8 n=1 Tax=Pristis pectinata TaxID=685728 RepID=UPI00223DB81D|nr:butyrophilin-like protein 8 [Pristis pectinata]
MSHLSVSFVGFVILLTTVQCVADGKGQVGVKCVEHHMAVKVGEDLVVLCHYSSPGEANSTTFSWTKLDTKKVIYNYSISQIEQDPSYHGRAEVFVSEIPEGNVSLRLRNMTLLDSGIYRLRVSSQSQSNETHIVLGVRAIGEQPVIRSHVTNQGLSVLVCESSGWFPEPTVTWENGLGMQLTEYAHTENLHSTDGSIHMRSVLSLGQRPISNYTCTMRDRHLNETVSFVFVVLFPGSPWHIAAGVAGTIICSVILTVAIYWSW